MEEGGVMFLDAHEVRKLEPNVICAAAVHAEKETAVDFGALTRDIRKTAEARGVLDSLAS